MVVREDLAQDYCTLADQQFAELEQLLDDFGESQEDIFSRLMEIRSEQQRSEPTTVLDTDSIEHGEPQPNSPEMTTTPGNIENDTDKTEPQSTACPQTEATAATNRSEPAEPSPTTQVEVDNIETPTTVEQGQDAQQSNKARTDITPSPDWNVRAEPNILEDE